MAGMLLLLITSVAATGQAVETCKPGDTPAGVKAGHANDTGDVAGLLQARHLRAPQWEEVPFEEWEPTRQERQRDTQGLRARPISISVYLAADDFYVYNDHHPFHPGQIGPVTGCDYSCNFLGKTHEQADVVVVSTQDGDMPHFKKKDGQRWIGHHEEPPYGCRSCRSILDEQYMQHFDYTCSYRPDSTVPFFLFFRVMQDWSSVMGHSPKYSYSEKSKRQHVMSAWISNCHFDQADRMALLKALRESGVSIASYGKCYHNHEVAQDAKAPPSMDLGDGDKAMWEKQKEAAKYLFMYAAENSRCPHYHSEKIFNALVAGTVPVYVGHRTVEEWVPKGSYIWVDDFEDSAELARYLKKVAANATLYNSFLAWRHRPLPAWIQRKVKQAQRMQTPSWRCDLCRFLHLHQPRASAHAQTCSLPEIKLANS